MRIILCLDLGTSTGWAMAALTPTGKIQTQSGTVSFANKGHDDGAGMRYLRFRRWLTEIHKDALVMVAFEEVKQRPASVAAGHMYGGFKATLTSWCEENSVPYEAIGVQAIKIAATGKGGASKKDVIGAMIAKGHKLRIDKNDTDSNEADALAMLYHVLSYATPSLVDKRPAPDRVTTRRVPLDPLRLPRRPVSR